MSKLFPEASTNVRNQVIENCWQYLLENFHKLNETNKIKVSLAITTRSIPTQINSNITVTEMPNIAIGNRIQEFIVGDSST